MFFVSDLIFCRCRNKTRRIGLSNLIILLPFTFIVASRKNTPLCSTSPLIGTCIKSQIYLCTHLPIDIYTLERPLVTDTTNSHAALTSWSSLGICESRSCHGLFVLGTVYVIYIRKLTFRAFRAIYNPQTTNHSSQTSVRGPAHLGAPL